MLFGDYSLAPYADAAKLAVRSVDNFDWTFIPLLAFAVITYALLYDKKDYKAIIAGLALYGVHWLYEIANAVICRVSGYALWTVSAESTSFILLIGVCWELSMMFSVAGIAAYKFLPKDRNMKIFGLDNRLIFAVTTALAFSLVEIFLASTPAFIWVYPWWGALPVFITTYIPFFLASNFVPDMNPRNQKLFLGIIWGADAVLLAVLAPLGII